MSDSATQLRTTPDEDEWADLSGDPERRHYSEFLLRRSRYYKGPLDRMSEEEVRALLSELFDYFLVDGFDAMPFPPSGLPGVPQEAYTYDDIALRLIGFGWDYFVAAALGRPRVMHNRWREAEEEAQRIGVRATSAYIEREVAAAMAKPRLSDSQQVYFIASQSGPIKIGVAADAMSRLKSLQTGHHERLDLLATCGGGIDQERAYHQRFAAHRLHGEWFERCPEILEEIARLALPLPKDTPNHDQ